MRLGGLLAFWMRLATVKSGLWSYCTNVLSFYFFVHDQIINPTVKMGTTFEDIPPGLLKALVSYVEPSSWKVLRLVNKALANHVTPLIFGGIEVWIQTQSLSK